MKAIIAAIDFSRGTELVVATAASLARGIGGKVLLLTVLAEPVFLEEYAPSTREIARISVGHARTVRHRLAALAQKLQSQSVPADVIVRRGDPAEHIVDEAEEHDAAFIVVGSHGHGALFEAVLGSTTQAVLRHARQPVVVIPAKMSQPPKPRGRVLSQATSGVTPPVP